MKNRIFFLACVAASVLLNIQGCMRSASQLEDDRSNLVRDSMRDFENPAHPVTGPGEAQVFGTVRTADGEIVKDRSVFLQLLRNQATRRTCNSDENGTFLFSNVPIARGLIIGTLIDTELMQSEILPMLSSGQKFGPVEIVLDPVGQITGYVYDDISKRALSGIDLILNHESSDYQGTRVIRSDDCGYFEFPSVPFGVVRIRAKSDQYWHHSRPDITINANQPAPHVQFYLQPPAQINGTIKRRDDSPLANITVSLGEHSSNPDVTLQTAITDSSGQFQMKLSRILNGSEVFQFAPGGQTIACSGKLQNADGSWMKIEPGQEYNVEFSLNDLSGKIFGKVSDFSGQPLANAKVRVFQKYGIQVQETQTDESGFYEFQNLFISGLDLVFLTASTPLHPEECKSFSDKIDSESGYRFDFELPAARTISGRIMTEAGVPLDNYEVKATRSITGFPDFTGPPTSRTISDSNGSFMIEGLMDGKYKITVCELEDGIRGRRIIYYVRDEAIAGESDLELVIANEFSLVLTVRNSESGEPITQYTVSLVDLAGDDSPGKKTFHSYIFVNSLTGRCKTIAPFSPNMKMTISRNNSRGIQEIFYQGSLDLSEVQNIHNMEISGPVMMDVLNGRVIDQTTGLGIPNAQISFVQVKDEHDRRKNFYRTISDRDGRFHLNCFQPDAYDVRVWSDAEQMQIRHLETVWIESIGNPYEIEVLQRQLPSFFGKVIDSETRQPVDAVKISYSSNRRLPLAESNVDGIFEIIHVSEDRISITITHDDYNPLVLEDLLVIDHADIDNAREIFLQRIDFTMHSAISFPVVL